MNTINFFYFLICPWEWGFFVVDEEFIICLALVGSCLTSFYSLKENLVLGQQYKMNTILFFVFFLIKLIKIEFSVFKSFFFKLTIFFNLLISMIGIFFSNLIKNFLNFVAVFNSFYKQINIALLSLLFINSQITLLEKNKSEFLLNSSIAKLTFNKVI